MKRITLTILMLCATLGIAHAVPNDDYEMYDGYKVAKGQVLVKGDVDEADEAADLGNGWQHVKNSQLSTRDLMDIYESEGKECEPNYIIELEPEEDDAVLVDLVPNDPMFNKLWGMNNTGQTDSKGQVGVPDADIDAPEAWDQTTGSADIVVGVVDTGIHPTHPDLIDNVWSAPSAFSVVILGTTYNCPAGSHGFNAVNANCVPFDDNHHGTHCSGTIAGTGGNGIGVAGVSHKAKVMGLKFLNSSGSGTTVGAVQAINFAIAVKAKFPTEANIRVLSNSWGGGGFSQMLLDAIKNADKAGMLFNAAAGNGNRSTEPPNPYFPQGYDSPNVMSIAATDNKDLRASFSNWGITTVDIGAPGVAIVSTTPGNTYSSFSGTSMATPHTSGAAALVLAKCPSLTPVQMKNLLIASVDKIPSMKGMVVSEGRLNVKKALDMCGGVITPPPTPIPTVGFGANPSSVTSGGSSTLNWLATNATSCVASGAWSGTKALNGSEVKTNITINSTYTLTCTGAGGTTAKSTTVTVTTPPPTADPVVVLTATPNKVEAGGSTTLTWSATNATSCVASGDWSGTKATTGSQTVTNLQSSSVFVLLCEGAGGIGVNVEFVDVGVPMCTPPADAPNPDPALPPSDPVAPSPNPDVPGDPGLVPSPVFGAGGGCSLFR